MSGDCNEIPMKLGDWYNSCNLIGIPDMFEITQDLKEEMIALDAASWVNMIIFEFINRNSCPMSEL